MQGGPYSEKISIEMLHEFAKLLVHNDEEKIVELLTKHHIDEKRAADEFAKAVINRYPNNPVISQYSYFPNSFQPLFSTQSELGKPVKIEKEYKNLFFSNLATVKYFHTYLSGILTFGFLGGVGKQCTAKEKKKYKTHIDPHGLYQYINGEKKYISNGFYRYIVSPKGGLYILTDRIENAFHNSFRGSQPVQCAGEVLIRNGQIFQIGNESGHYRPTREQLLRTIGGLYAAGFIVNTDVEVRAFEKGYLSYSFNLIGTIRELIRSGEIKIPSSWKATQDIHDRMASLASKMNYENI